MKAFEFTINDKLGLHARPAGELVKLAKSFTSEIIIEKNAKFSDATKLFGVMAMNIKCGDSIIVKIEGEDEDKAAEAIEKFFNENL